MAKKKKTYLTEAGKTPEGRTVLAGVGLMCFTAGVPLEVILQYFMDSDLVVDWADYIDLALKDGHNPQTILSRIESAVGEVYGPQYREEVVLRARNYLGASE